jgi:NAD(P)-dependent dehydrogenase (short-subunit alcohol dehydrogenase family)
MPLNFNKLQDKHVLIIGGSSGIGRGVSEGVLQAGGKVTIASSNQVKIDNAITYLKAVVSGARIIGLSVDLKSADLEKVLSDLLVTAAKAHGNISHVVYTAADPIPSAALSAFTQESFERATRLRFLVPFTLVKVIVAGEHLARDRSSSIVLTGGNVAVHPMPDWALVNFIASGLEGATRGLALDIAPIRVNLVAPGVVDTMLWGDEVARKKMVEQMDASMPTRKIGQIEDVVEAYLWLLRDGNSTGTVARTESGHNLL